MVEDEDAPDESNPAITHGVRNILLILLLLIIIGVIGYVVLRKRSGNESSVPNTADQIRDSFNPPTTSTSTFTPPPPSNQASGPATGTPSSTQPRATAPRSTAPDPARPQPAAPAYPTTPVVYRNDNLGFEMVIPGSWVADDKQDPSRVVFFDRNTGQIAGYVETYHNVTGESLHTLAETFQGSPSIANISQITVSGQPALAYTATKGFSSGVATVHNNRIYYLHGVLTSEQALSGFRFVS